MKHHLFWLLPSLLFGSIPEIIDYSRLTHSCHATSPTWGTGQLAFNGAPEVGTFLTYLKKTYNVPTAVETGTFLGNTTSYLSLLFDQVYTIEIVRDRYESTSAKLKNFSNVECLLGSSEVVFQDLLPILKNERVLFYLDAHWDDHWPLLDELREISKTHFDNCIIIVDDFKVPNRKDIPFDQYLENECSFNCIKDQLGQVFSDYEIHYIIPANIQSRAKFVAYPKKFASLP